MHLIKTLSVKTRLMTTHKNFGSKFCRAEDENDKYSIMMLVTFLTSANRKHWIWSCDELGLCNPRFRLLGDEVIVGSSLMFRKMDAWNVIRKYKIHCRTGLTKINCKEIWYSVGKMTFLIRLFYQTHLHLNVLNFNFIWKIPVVSPTQINK